MSTDLDLKGQRRAIRRAAPLDERTGAPQA
jgi:hypothetical protein